MFVGIGLIGTITSTVTSFFTQQQSDKFDEELNGKLDEISDRLKKIEQKLGE